VYVFCGKDTLLLVVVNRAMFNETVYESIAVVYKETIFVKGKFNFCLNLLSLLPTIQQRSVNRPRHTSNIYFRR